MACVARMSVRAHSFTERVLHWHYCAGCGLIEMRNTASRSAAARPCGGKNQRVAGADAERLWRKLQREGFA